MSPDAILGVMIIPTLARPDSSIRPELNRMSLLPEGTIMPIVFLPFNLVSETKSISRLYRQNYSATKACVCEHFIEQRFQQPIFRPCLLIKMVASSLFDKVASLDALLKAGNTVAKFALILDIFNIILDVSWVWLTAGALDQQVARSTLSVTSLGVKLGDVYTLSPLWDVWLLQKVIPFTRILCVTLLQISKLKHVNFIMWIRIVLLTLERHIT